MSRNIHDSRMAVALTKCYFCGDSDKLVLNSLLTEGMAKRVDEMNGMVIDMQPCPKCRGYMQQGVILITIDNEKSEPGWSTPPDRHEIRSKYHADGTVSHRKVNEGWMPNPYRTGGFFVLKDIAIEQCIHPEAMAQWALKHRWMFIEHKAAEMIGLFDQAKAEAAAKERLEYLRGELNAERISYGEIVELQSLAAYIAPDDVQLLEAAGIPEHKEEAPSTTSEGAAQQTKG